MKAAKAQLKTSVKSVQRSQKKAAATKKAASPLTEVLASPPAQVGEADLVELFPHGISVGAGVSRPVLILKDKSGNECLPVWVHPLDAAVALAELSQGAATPHAVTRRLLESLKLELHSCRFTELVGHHQFVSLSLSGEGGPREIRVRADEAMSFCLQGKARFFSTRTFMACCRDLDADLSKLEHNLAQGLLPELQAELNDQAKKHPYLM